MKRCTGEKTRGRRWRIRDLKPLLPYIREFWKPLTAGFVFILLQNLAVAEVPHYFRIMLDEITSRNRRGEVLDAIWMALLFTGMAMISMYLMRKLIIGTSRRIEYRLRSTVFDKLLRLDTLFYRNRETGDLVSRSTNDLNDVRTLLGPGLMYIPNSVSRFAMFLPIMLGLSPSLMAMISGLMVMVVALILILMPRMRKLYRSVQVSVADINNRVWQTIAGIDTIKLYTLERIQTDRFGARNRAYIRHNMALAKYRGFIWPFFVFIFSMAELLILVVGGRQVIDGQLTIGQLLQFNMLVAYLTFPILSLGWIMSLIQQGISAMGRINEVLDFPEEVREQTIELPDRPLNVQVRDLTFRYRPDDEPVLSDVSLDLRPGEAVGITGTIGSGKTTLVDLITGVLRPERGMIFVNGVDIVDLDPAELARRMSVVPQDPFLFSRTLLENISLGMAEADRERASRSAELAGLKRDIQALQNGLDEVVGERGITLSGGQKQRTAIARALNQQSGFLVLDDALSAVDSRTEEKILEGIAGLRDRSTMLIVSHRISSLKELDRIYVMDEGTIVESGAHDDLIMECGLYTRLAWLQQMGGETTGSAS